MYYYWGGTGEYWRSTELFDAWTIVAVLVAVAMLHGVWRLWRGMRLDPFERSIRALRQRPADRSIEFPRRRRPTHQTRGFQVSLLPLMLVSGGLAILLAQAQRPDDVSRPATWMLFLTVGAWYGAGAWSHRRGFGPLRNEAFAAIATTTLLSALLWGFYSLVDFYHQEPGYGRLTTSVPVLLWWTSVGGALGVLIGAFRANRIYCNARSIDRAEDAALPASFEASLAAPDTLRKVRWRGSTTAISLACLASLVIHLAAVPQVYQKVRYRYLWWNTHHASSWNHSFTLTMAESSQPSRLDVAAATIDLAINDIDGEMADTLDVRETLRLTEPWNGPPRPVTTDQGVDVYVANRPLKAGTRLQRSMFTVKNVAVDSAGADLVASNDWANSTLLTRDVAAGELLTKADLANGDFGGPVDQPVDIKFPNFGVPNNYAINANVDQAGMTFLGEGNRQVVMDTPPGLIPDVEVSPLGMQVEEEEVSKQTPSDVTASQERVNIKATKLQNTWGFTRLGTGDDLPESPSATNSVAAKSRVLTVTSDLSVLGDARSTLERASGPAPLPRGEAEAEAQVAGRGESMTEAEQPLTVLELEETWRTYRDARRNETLTRPETRPAQVSPDGKLLEQRKASEKPTTPGEPEDSRVKVKDKSTPPGGGIADAITLVFRDGRVLQGDLIEFNGDSVLVLVNGAATTVQLKNVIHVTQRSRIGKGIAPVKGPVTGPQIITRPESPRPSSLAFRPGQAGQFGDADAGASLPQAVQQSDVPQDDPTPPRSVPPGNAQPVPPPIRVTF